MNQVCLLLRGDGGLGDKVAKRQAGSNRIHQLVMGKQKPLQVRKKKAGDGEQQWKVVGARGKASAATQQGSSGGKRYMLLESEWSHGLLSSFTRGATGLHFEHELQEALLHERQ